MERPGTRIGLVSLGFCLLLALAWGLYSFSGSGALVGGSRVLRVLAYASFVNSWGPGAEIAKRFEDATGVRVELRDAEDAGLLLRKLELFPADVVLGFDQLLLKDARSSRKWRMLPTADVRFAEPEFMPFDWGPLAFVYRKGEVEPPKSLDDLLSPRFAKKLALEDPRTSSPGLMFLYWVLDEKGIDEGFKFIEKLRGSIHTLSPSWSLAYGVFQDKQASLVLSYLTSPVFHAVTEKDDSYEAAVFSAGHPLQIEYAGVPDSCRECELATEFTRFLLKPEIQKLIMEKNYMLPVVAEVAVGTPFERVPTIPVRRLESIDRLQGARAEILARWRELKL